MSNITIVTVLCGVPVEIERGEHGLYYGTSPKVRGLLVTGNTYDEVVEQVPRAIEELQTVTKGN